MGMTIKDISKLAGVSTATVSHVINKTRFVSPKIVAKVEAIMLETGYDKKIAEKIDNYHFGKSLKISLVIPNLEGTLFAQFSNRLFEYLKDEGYILNIYLTQDNIQYEKHLITDIMSNRKVAGIIWVPASEESSNYKKLLQYRFPIVCLERTLKNTRIDSVVVQNYEGIVRGMEHLIKNGHERIGIILENRKITPVDDKLDAYKDTLERFKIPFRKDYIVQVDMYNMSDQNIIEHIESAEMPTAFIAGGNTLTLKLLKSMEEIGLECPDDISVIGCGDNEWSSMITPSLTTLTQNIGEMARLAVHQITERIKNDGQESAPVKVESVPVNLTIGKSTQVISRGPFGEKTAYPEVLALSEEEINILKKGNFKVGISFHYTGNEWAELHEQAIRETFTQLGIKLLAIMDANFEPELQSLQLESLIMQKPDAIIAVPSDDVKIARTFKDISRKTNLILINNMPVGFELGDYSTWISVNERENGQNAAKLLGEHFGREPHAKVALLVHGTPFFATQQRDFAVEQSLLEYYPNIDIVCREPFYEISSAYEACKRVISEHPDIQGIYISWDKPALEAIRCLKEIHRTDIAVVTTDLGEEIAGLIAREDMVIGLSSQRPYQQGVAVALATANALLGRREYKSIGTQPYLVTRRNLSKAWHDIMRSPEPDSIRNYSQTKDNA